MNPLKLWKDTRPEQDSSGFFSIIVLLFYILAAIAVLMWFASLIHGVTS
ncbi:hypothetical protein HQ393_05050 [Chitinibacter bivalviorum]|uniref:Uncharacterized protein n=1 Tax=Chitinibacter bivalviorum TaxID=2739434 RepID=A0A7H9BGZ0_9NEIS|nr:hypothetical protein [Chitinibacter bivalviorum]QLG87672.1 hypothetical protein HQ393_05050 [Chitinibacter bivalviorum]